MQAKVIATGEIVDVECAGIDGMSVMFKEISSTSAKTFRQSQLDFGYNNPPTDKNIDWEKRRFELVKAVTQGCLSRAVSLPTVSAERKIFSKIVLDIADALIKELKGNEK